MRKAIVTGATGFLGGWLVKELASQGVEVIAVVRSRESGEAALAGYGRVRVVACPLPEMLNLPSLINDEDVDVFYHLAWAGVTGTKSRAVSKDIPKVRFSGNCQIPEESSPT